MSGRNINADRKINVKYGSPAGLACHDYGAVTGLNNCAGLNDT